MDTAPVILLLLGRGLGVSEAEQRQEPHVSLKFVPEPFLVDTPFGRGYALFVETDHHENWWTVELQESGALMTLAQREITIARNYSLGIGMNATDMRKVLRRLDEK